ncbi:MAG: hypothetical protein ACKOHI_10765, partial [Phycisphaerales bacterium]
MAGATQALRDVDRRQAASKHQHLGTGIDCLERSGLPWVRDECTARGAVIDPVPRRARGTLIADPWETGAFEAIDPGAEVLVLGSGLTAIDVAQGLRR